MKKLLISIIVTLQICAVGCDNRSNNQYVINGSVENGGNGSMLYLINMDNDFNTAGVDSTLVKDGKFVFKGKLNSAVEKRLLCNTRTLKLNNSNICKIYLEPVVMNIVIPSLDSLKESVLIGSQTQDEIYDFEAQVKDVYEPLQKVNDDFYTIRDRGDAIALAKVKELLNDLGKQYLDLESKWMDEHPESYYTFMQKSRMVSRMNIESVDSLFKSFPQKFKGTDVYNEVEKKLKNLMNTIPGAIATDFSDTDINGDSFKLSDLKGNYIILDFWASWCVPCRASMPHLKAVYEKYKDNGLKVVCVSDDDRSEDKWKAAVKNDGTEDFYHVLRGLKRTSTGYDHSEDKTVSYSVSELPTKFLIGPDFEIVGKVDDEELEKFLNDAYGF